ncbi:MAG: hypothetical protein M0Z42_04470, partial [Actinomycetota bacterium]|nr:hypothetical protein [Actinomycetota bacterium]
AYRIVEHHRDRTSSHVSNPPLVRVPVLPNATIPPTAGSYARLKYCGLTGAGCIAAWIGSQLLRLKRKRYVEAKSAVANFPIAMILRADPSVTQSVDEPNIPPT